MCAAKLMEALNDCIINFDRRVLLTDLINEYHLPLEEVSRTLMEYLMQQEQEGVKYEKRFVVHGTEADDSSKELFTIVKGEDKLEEWLNKLNDAESALYSVEVDGGAKAPADDLKPVTWCAVKLDNSQSRKKGSKQQNSTAVKSSDNAAVKVEIKPETKTDKDFIDAFDKNKPCENSRDAASTKVKKEAASEDSKKVSPQSTKNVSEREVAKQTPQKSTELKKFSPKDKKSAAAAASGQKGIGNFFAPKSKDKTETSNKTVSAVTRQKSPKKLNDFFKKQADKSATPKEVFKQEDKKANTSVQLFEEDDEEEKEKNEKNLEDKELVESTDEEEELNNLRRKVEDADKEEAATSSRKRLRIEDSDDEEEDEKEEPKHKQGKIEESTVAEKESPPKSETFLDEDGFVITVKSKKARSKSNTPATTSSKTPTKAISKESKPKQTPTAAAKTKQGNIMNFFKKK